jgi:hypothetical protein
MSTPPDPTDAQAKADHAVRLMHVAAQVADLAADDRQQRILARYVHLNAEPAQLWLGVWANEASSQGTKPELKRFRRTWSKQKAIRDKLAAKRQAIAPSRSVDLRATVDLWSSMTRSGVRDLCDSAAEACAALGSANDFAAPLDKALADELRKALLDARLDPESVFTDATSYSLGEPHLLATADSGARGQRITQVNDVHAHLDLLYALRQFAERTDDLGLLLRAALVVEVCSLVELVVGPPPGAQVSRREGVPLRDLVDHNPEVDGENYLALLCGDDFDQYRVWLRFAREKAAAHLDRQIPFDDLRDLLLDADPDHLFHLADAVLDVLDLAACGHVHLRLLALGNRKMHGMRPAPARSVPAALESDENIALLDADYVAWSAGGFDQMTHTRMAGVMAGRPANRRSRWYPEP